MKTITSVGIFSNPFLFLFALLSFFVTVRGLPAEFGQSTAPEPISNTVGASKFLALRHGPYENDLGVESNKIEFAKRVLARNNEEDGVIPAGSSASYFDDPDLPPPGGYVGPTKSDKPPEKVLCLICEPKIDDGKNDKAIKEVLEEVEHIFAFTLTAQTHKERGRDGEVTLEAQQKEKAAMLEAVKKAKDTVFVYGINGAHLNKEKPEFDELWQEVRVELEKNEEIKQVILVDKHNIDFMTETVKHYEGYAPYDLEKKQSQINSLPGKPPKDYRQYYLFNRVRGASRHEYVADKNYRPGGNIVAIAGGQRGG